MARRASWTVAAALLLGGILLAALVSSLAARRSAAVAGAEAGAAAGAGTAPPAGSLYDTVLQDPDGRPLALAQWKGRPLVLNFWATWCAPCVAEMPELERTQAGIGNAVIVGIGTEDPARVREFRDRLHLHMPLAAGGYDALVLARTLGDAQGVLPYTVLLSPDGHVLQTQAGPLRPGQIRDWLHTPSP